MSNALYSLYLGILNIGFPQNSTIGLTKTYNLDDNLGYMHPLWNGRNMLEPRRSHVHSRQATSAHSESVHPIWYHGP